MINSSFDTSSGVEETVHPSPEGASYTEQRPVAMTTHDNGTPFHEGPSSQSTVDSTNKTENGIESMDVQYATTLGNEASQMVPQGAVEKSDAKLNTGVQKHSAGEQEGASLDIIVRNVCCKFFLGRRVDLKFIATNGVNVELRNNNKGVLLIQLRRPRTCAFITASGHVRCVKSPSEFEARVSARRLARYIETLYKRHSSLPQEQFKIVNFRYVNALATACLPMAIRLTPFSEKYASNGEVGIYEPEVFPGVTYRLPHLNSTVNVFSTGRLTASSWNVMSALSAVGEMVPKMLRFCRPRTEQETTNLQLQQLKKYIKLHDENFLEKLLG